jgi:hypothetical protein
VRNMRTNLKSGTIFFAAVILFYIFTTPRVSAQNFTLTGSMTVAREGHTATLLNDGTVLIAGGFNGNGFLAGAELYNPATGTFTLTGSLNEAREGHEATLLDDGTVLIAGGFNGTTLASAELYNPATRTFTLTGSLNAARNGLSATLLGDGRVLIAGGAGTVCELYNPATGTFTLTGSLNVARGSQRATPVSVQNNGMVLIEGGGPGFLASAELFNPATGTFTLTGSLNDARVSHTATLLINDLVLIAGGEQAGATFLTSAEVYNPTTGRFTHTGNLNTPRSLHTATLLNDGRVLIAAGSNLSSVALANAELYNPVTGTFTLTGSLNTARFDPTATLLNNGMVLIAGGGSSSLGYLDSAELYEPAAPTASPTSQSKTQPLSPTALNQFQFDNNVHNYTVQYPAGTSFSGVNMTVTAAQISQASFRGRVAGTPFANALCIIYEGENGFCEDYQVRCTDTSGNSIACPTGPTPASITSSYATQQTITNPGFLTTPLGINDWSNTFYAYFLPRIDATIKGRTTGFSEFVAVDLGASNTQAAAQFTRLEPLQSADLGASSTQAAPQFKFLGPLQNDVRIFPVGTIIPVEFQLTSIAPPGIPVTDAIAGITLTMLSGANGNPISRAVLEIPSAFRFEEGEYVYDLSTAGHAPGIYSVTVFGNVFVPQSVQFTLPVSTSGAHLVTTVQSLTLNSNTNQYIVVLKVANSGNNTANGVIVAASKLNSTSTSTTLPISLGDIGSGASATVTLTYPTSAGAAGSRGVLTISESYAGGSAGGGSRVTLP